MKNLRQNQMKVLNSFLLDSDGTREYKNQIKSHRLNVQKKKIVNEFYGKVCC